VTFPAHTDPNVPTLHVFIPLAFGIKAKCWLTVTCPCACQPSRPTGGAEIQLHRFLTCAQLVCQRSAS
jgi:hypothetical protein